MAPLRVLLIKPYQTVSAISYAPPLGLLYLTSALRRRFGDAISVRIIDAKLGHQSDDDLRADLAAADVVGVSALNYEAPAAFAIARLTKVLDPAKLVVLGGPFAHRRAEEILAGCADVDWVFDGESERTFPEAIARRLAGAAPDGTIPGMYFRDGDRCVAPLGNDFVTDLDALPWPAWDLVDFDGYAGVQNFNGWMRGTRYATLFTSRGCPYKCAYCHDIFTKKFRWRSPEDVVGEMSLLIERYGVDEFQIVDDIFNLHKPRLKRIFALLKERYPDRRLYFCFPNGVRADILDREVVRVLKEAGTYQITLAVETVTDRLQKLITKHLDVEKTRQFIDYCDEEGIIVKGFFMLGFPTETRREIWNTIRFALRSRLTFAHFFAVVPQPGTRLFELAEQKAPQALEGLGEAHYWDVSWYQLATGFPLKTVIGLTFALFHLYPRRALAIVRYMGIGASVRNVGQLIAIFAGFNPFAVRQWLRGGKQGPATTAPAGDADQGQKRVSSLNRTEAA